MKGTYFSIIKKCIERGRKAFIIGETLFKIDRKVRIPRCIDFQSKNHIKQSEL